jgi:hypothetical protein
MIRDPEHEGINRVLCHHPHHRRAFKERMVVCFFWQMIISYQTEFLVVGRFRFGNRGDAALMKWLYDRLSTQRMLEAESGGHLRPIARMDSSEEACLDLAAMAQAVKIAGACAPRPNDAPGPSTREGQVDDPLADLRAGVNSLLERFRTDGMYPSEEIVHDFVSMMMWWETDDGMEGLRCLIGLIDGSRNDAF